MDALDLVLRAGVVLFMVGSLGGVGLGLAPRDALAPLMHGRFVALTLVGCWLVCPAVAYLLLLVVPLERPYAAGLLLVALSPCAPFAPAMVQVARGNAAYVAAFLILSAATTVVFMPVAIPLLISGLAVDAMAIARPLLIFVLLPLALGMTINAASGRAAKRIQVPVALITNVLGVLVLVLIGVRHGGAVIDAVGSLAIAAQVLFIGAVTITAYQLGAGLIPEQRSVLTLGVCTRNLGAALAPLATVDSDPRAMVMIAIAAPVTIVLSAGAARWLARRSRPAAQPSTAPASMLGSGRR